METLYRGFPPVTAWGVVESEAINLAQSRILSLAPGKGASYSASPRQVSKWTIVAPSKGTGSVGGPVVQTVTLTGGKRKSGRGAETAATSSVACAGWTLSICSRLTAPPMTVRTSMTGGRFSRCRDLAAGNTVLRDDQLAVNRAEF